MVSQSTLNQKQVQIDALSKVAGDSTCLVAVEYRGMTVTQMNTLRKKSREQGVYMKIVKNTLARRALSSSQYAGLVDEVKGPIVLCFSLGEEPNTAAKLIHESMKELKVLKVRTIGLESKVLAADAIDKVAKMPNKQQAIGMLLGVMQAPVQGLACVFQETYAKLVRTVSEVAKVKQAKQ